MHQPRNAKRRRFAIVEIRNVGDLPPLLTFPRNRRVRVDLHLPGIPPDDQPKLAQELTRLVNACGCGEAGLAGLLSLGITSAVLIARTVAWNFSAVGWLLGGSLAGLIAGVVAGKLFGLGTARRRLKHLIRTLTDPVWTGRDST